MVIVLTSGQEERLNAIAERSASSINEVALRNFDEFLSYREHFLSSVDEGIAAADRAELHDHEDVMRMIDDIIANG